MTQQEVKALAEFLASSGKLLEAKKLLLLWRELSLARIVLNGIGVFCGSEEAHQAIRAWKTMSAIPQEDKPDEPNGEGSGV